MKKKIIAIGLLIAALSFGLGMATSERLLIVLQTIGVEYGNRYYRDANNQIMWNPDPTTMGYWYWQGRLDARLEDFIFVADIFDVELAKQ